MFKQLCSALSTIPTCKHSTLFYLFSCYSIAFNMIPARIMYGRSVGQALGSQRVCLVSWKASIFDRITTNAKRQNDCHLISTTWFLFRLHNSPYFRLRSSLRLFRYVSVCARIMLNCWNNCIWNWGSYTYIRLPIHVPCTGQMRMHAALCGAVHILYPICKIILLLHYGCLLQPLQHRLLLLLYGSTNTT